MSCQSRFKNFTAESKLLALKNEENEKKVYCFQNQKLQLKFTETETGKKNIDRSEDEWSLRRCNELFR